MNKDENNKYSYYQILCGYSEGISEKQFRTTLFKLLTQYYDETQICLTVHAIHFDQSMYPGKYPCAGEPSAIISISTNPNHYPDAKVHVKWISDKLAKIYQQHVVPVYPVSKASGVFVSFVK